MLKMSVKCDGERRLDGGVKDETLDYLVANGTIKRQEGMSVLKHAAFNNRAGSSSSSSSYNRQNN